MPRVLITGIAGFAGSHLADILLQDPANDVIGIRHPDHLRQHTIDNQRLEMHSLDILQPEQLEKTIQLIAPDVIYHLAGLAHVQESWSNRRATMETNFLGTFHLLEACRSLPKFPKILLVGSGECYGIVPEGEQPISESRPLAPASPYAVSKIAQEILGMQYAHTEKFPVFLSRSFNHMGPRQKETFVCSAFAKQIAMAELGLSGPEIKVGNLIARRDFLDVRDTATAYISILRDGRPGEPYNVCSGSAFSIQELLGILLTHATIKCIVVSDPQKFRPVDMPLLLGSSKKLQEETGWKPRYQIHESLLDLLNYWREKLKDRNS
jgi:GDP-4-dehydro-6-deoxy-D-mannose reductase